ncbi:putative histidine phosphotransferase HPT1p [Tricharina praecox]|uniref:putative histidine phosphotransferase HPT1p n=1 Tax=Tricharina praecox TaxID=43433 RepID=UPI00221F5461|nr:putative histidine phosphotransferase HPT1p [Tricharina praecox]KAI5855809.1 putative histidine phosphotransferase HPT1p [Tricharina praecox]
MPPAADPPTSPTAAAAPVAAPEKALVVEEIIDMATFEQIREMDDEGSDEFSRAIVTGFLDQARETFDQMDTSIQKKDLEQLSSLGHFLKGSSATLGLVKIKDYCEKVQHFGENKDETGTLHVPDNEKCLSAIAKALKGMRDEYEKVVQFFDEVYPPEEEA